MKKLSFLIISLFLSSTLSYGHEIQKPDIVETQNDPIGYVLENIDVYEGLIDSLGNPLENEDLKHAKETVITLYTYTKENQ